MKKISVPIVAGSTPSRFQNAAVSVSKMSWHTIHFRLPSAARCSAAFCPPTAGFWPHRIRPSMPPSFMVKNIGMCE